MVNKFPVSRDTFILLWPAPIHPSLDHQGPRIIHRFAVVRRKKTERAKYHLRGSRSYKAGQSRSKLSRGYIDLKNQALLVRLAGLAGQESRARSVLEHLADALVGPGRALKVLVGTDLLADLLTLVQPY